MEEEAVKCPTCSYKMQVEWHSLAWWIRLRYHVCDNCGEYYLSDRVTRALLRRAEVAVQNGAEVEILGYAA